MPQPYGSYPNQPLEDAIPRAGSIVAKRVGHRVRISAPEPSGHGRPNRHTVTRRGDGFGQTHQFVGFFTGQHILIGAHDRRNAGRVERRFDRLRFGIGAHEDGHRTGAESVSHESAHLHRYGANGQRRAAFLGDAVLRGVVCVTHPHPFQRTLAITQQRVGHAYLIRRRDRRHADELGTTGERLPVVVEQLRHRAHHRVGAAVVREERVPLLDIRGGCEVRAHIGVAEGEDRLFRIADQKHRTPGEGRREDGELRRVGILKLVDQCHPEALPDSGGQHAVWSFRHQNVMQPTQQVVKAHQVARLLFVLECLRYREHEVAQQLRRRVGSGVDHGAGMPHIRSQQIPDPAYRIFAARSDQRRRRFVV